jgi:HSP20 family molecular chaperone IbpA
MADAQELQVQQKRELEKKAEATTPVRVFVPVTDIFETPQALTVVLEMPGVDRNSIEASVENDVVTIEGRIDFAKYEGDAAGLHRIQCRPLRAQLPDF